MLSCGCSLFVGHVCKQRGCLWWYVVQLVGRDYFSGSASCVVLNMLQMQWLHTWSIVCGVLVFGAVMTGVGLCTQHLHNSYARLERLTWCFDGCKCCVFLGI
jgi:hypothetical protein